MSEETAETTESAETAEETAAGSVAGEEVETTETEETETEEGTEEQEEGQEPPEGEEGKHKRPGKPLTERIAEIEKNVEAKFAAKVKELQAQLNQVTEKQTAAETMAPLDYDAINKHVANVTEQIETLKLEGKAYEALKLQKSLDKLDAEIEDYEAKRAEGQKAKTEQEKNALYFAQLNQRIEKAAELVRTDAKMTPEAFQKAREFFEAERIAKPLVNAQYIEVMQNKGEVSAILWAKDYCEKNMGVKEKQEQLKREEGKKKLAPSGSSTASQTTLKAEADALYAELQKDPSNTDLHIKWREAKSKLK